MPLDNLAGVFGYSGGFETAPTRFLPYLDHCAPGAMLLRDGSVMGMLRMPGPPIALASNRDRNGALLRLVALLNAIADDNVEAFIHLVRHEGIPPLPGRPAAVTAFDAMFLEDWTREVRRGLRVNDWFLTVLVRPRGTPFSMTTDVLKRLPPVRAIRGLWQDRHRADADARDDERAAHDDRMGQLEDAMGLAMGLLRDARPVRLGLRPGPEGSDLLYSEIAEALELIRTTKHHPQPLVAPPGTLGAALAAHDPIAGRGGFEVRYGAGGTDGHFGQVYGVTAFPRTIWQNQFDELLALDGNFVLTNHIRFMNRGQQQDHMKHLRRLMETAGEEYEAGAAKMKAAITEVATGQQMRGYCRWSLAFHAEPDPAIIRQTEETGAEYARRRYRNAMRQVDALASRAKTILVNAGIRIAAEGRGAKSALIAQTPGAPRMCQIRAGILPTDYFASLAPVAGFARGPDSFRWGGPTLPMQTTAGTLFVDDLFVGDVAHLAMVAPNGEGKTTYLGANITAARALVRAGQRPGTQILLDMDHSNEQTIIANGGSYMPVLAEEDSGVAPLRLADTRRTRAMLRMLVAGLCRLAGTEPGAEDIQGIREGVDFVMGEVPAERRHLGIIRDFMGFQEGGAGAALERWCRKYRGELAWTFDGQAHRIDFDVELVGVDLTAIKDHPLVMPAMGQLLLWMASEMMDGRRCLVWCEEAPAYFERPDFSALGKGLALRGRKRNTAFIAIAQMPEHLLNNEAGKAIVKQARKLVLFRNGAAERADYVDGLGVPEPVFQMVQRGMFSLPYRSVLIFRKDGQTSVNRFDLSGETLRKYLAIFSGTTNSVRLFRRIQAKNGPGDMRRNLEEFWQRQAEAAA
ncbi:VirB4 family type IV secretion/conjugal transfer ATPase [Paracraurococcus lichenis]|uniref:CagE TrbE VirB component of type IV transporter system central domain-containing protein n=1 Tax=Paracraurococcus lichenis TaxID=3064888 RepID=A0ABT9EAK8_9PROT|nr:hypothetical protein [Paracraurococcus sp. LOR1-02]MDO9713191.1 hypothetical protein [Paracraurococcus sp. LOR1-02]